MPSARTTPKGYQRAHALRQELTPAERRLWACLSRQQLGVRFRRQHALGIYIADFCCIQKKLIIELDGSQHLEQDDYDRERTRHLEALGFRVIRFWNNELMNDIEGVIKAILFALEECPPSESPPVCADQKTCY
jgi:very-short-patch-repair endonuclease